MKEAEERAMASSSKTKKTVKLTLQELHSLPSPGVHACMRYADSACVIGWALFGDIS